MKIAIADDHAIVRKGLKFILENQFGDIRLDESGSGEELLNLVRNNNYDLIILDISMPGKDVIDTIKELKDLKPKIPILIFSMNPEKAYAIRMLRSGASGYINKDCTHEELIEAINKVISGKGYISTTLSELLASEIREGSEKPIHQTLTDREFQIFCMIALGNSLDEIADKLFLSKNTISNHRHSIMKKLKLKNNAEITAYALKNEIVI